MATCSRCGSIDTEVDDGRLPSGWSLVTDDRGIGFVCARCTRDNIRNIEAKLPDEYWQ